MMERKKRPTSPNCEPVSKKCRADAKRQQDLFYMADLDDSKVAELLNELSEQSGSEISEDKNEGISTPPTEEIHKTNVDSNEGVSEPNPVYVIVITKADNHEGGSEPNLPDVIDTINCDNDEGEGVSEPNPPVFDTTNVDSNEGVSEPNPVYVIFITNVDEHEGGSEPNLPDVIDTINYDNDEGDGVSEPNPPVIDTTNFDNDAEVSQALLHDIQTTGNASCPKWLLSEDNTFIDLNLQRLDNELTTESPTPQTSSETENSALRLPQPHCSSQLPPPPPPSSSPRPRPPPPALPPQRRPRPPQPNQNPKSTGPRRDSPSPTSQHTDSDEEEDHVFTWSQDPTPSIPEIPFIGRGLLLTLPNEGETNDFFDLITDEFFEKLIRETNYFSSKL